MARRKSSIFDDLIEIGAALPLWASIALAFTAWYGFGSYAATEALPVNNLNGAASQASGQLLRSMAAVLKYLVPAALLLGALVSAIRSAKRGEVYKSLKNSSASTFKSRLDRISWQQFEGLVQELFYRRGYKVTETESGPDGGVDLKLRKGDSFATVQCKHWRKKKVGVNIVREQLGVVVGEGAEQGFVVTSGEFTDDAELFARGKPVTLVDGGELCQLLGIFAYDVDVKEEQVAAQPKVSCPSCGSDMTTRRARRGKNAGKMFWGCSQFPNCRGTRSLS